MDKYLSIIILGQTISALLRHIFEELTLSVLYTCGTVGVPQQMCHSRCATADVPQQMCHSRCATVDVLQ